jgi:hypothetical protein
MVSEAWGRQALPDREERQRILESAIHVLHDAQRVVARCDATRKRLEQRPLTRVGFAYGMEPHYSRAFSESTRLE